MEKPASNDYPIHDPIRRRWSPRAFDPDRPVDATLLASLLEAARWAPSSYNEQPWSFLVARREDEEAFARLLGCLAPANRSWAEHAGVLLASLAKRDFDRNGEPNRHAWYDVGQATALLTVEATVRDLWLHQMAGYDADAVRREHEIPDEWEPVAMIALGYQADSVERLPERLHEAETKTSRSRKPLDAFVFTGRFGTVASFLD